MRKGVFRFVVIAALISCGARVDAQSSKVIPTAEEISDARAIIEDEFVHPDSVIYRDVTVTRTTHALIFCGEVDAKNELGDYAGFVPFVLFGMDLKIFDGPPGLKPLFKQNVMYICNSGLRWSVDGFESTRPRR
ncbi:hypothetical protein [Asticcacaulis tiandongensis]|uniref:hypothetical protein n=1 Tax=Asticcacaulis tiandongensis TaxID=2565365 RepID=UPI0011263B14|nr:hypothetical protein [Asticcacaulis tiandongensis]